MNSAPQHIAIIMDGNGRWAQKHHMPRSFGHASGAAVVLELVRTSIDLGIKYLTIFAFSTENWKRPKEEVSNLMRIFLEYLQEQVKNLTQTGVRLQVIGDITNFDEELQNRITETIKTTANNNKIILTIAANYGGHWDIVRAVQSWHLANPKLGIVDITQQELEKYLSTARMQDPDLLIRTGGEQRISNFMLWQLAYTELYFTDILWPDFKSEQLKLALDWYQKRKRRFGAIYTK